LKRTMTYLERDLAYGRLRIDFNDDGLYANISNFVGGKHSMFKLTKEFGKFQDFGLTFEHIFLLFANENAVRVIGFDSIRNCLFECVQNTEDGWSRNDLEISIDIIQIDRRISESWIHKSNGLSNLHNNVFLAANLFKVYLVRNDLSTQSSTIQRIFSAKSPSIKTPIHTIDQTVKKVCTGNDFILLLTQNGHVFSMGTGSRGELGIEPMEAQSSSPKSIEDFIEAEIEVQDIACGGWHGLALTSEKDVYAWGLNSDGQCGLSADEAKVLEIPHPINLAQSVKNIRAGMKSTFIELEDGSTVVYGKP